MAPPPPSTWWPTILSAIAILVGGVALGIGCSAQKTAKYNRQAGIELTAWARDQLRPWTVHTTTEATHTLPGAHDPPPPPPPW